MAHTILLLTLLFAWNPSAAATGYSLYSRTFTTDPWVLVAQTPDTQVQVTLPCAPWEFVVRASNSAGESGNSNAVAYQPPAADSDSDCDVDGSDLATTAQEYGRTQ